MACGFNIRNVFFWNWSHPSFMDEKLYLVAHFRLVLKARPPTIFLISIYNLFVVKWQRRLGLILELFRSIRTLEKGKFNTTKKQHCTIPTLQPHSLGNTLLKNENRFIVLGIAVTKDLSWNNQNSSLAKRPANTAHNL